MVISSGVSYLIHINKMIVNSDFFVLRKNFLEKVISFLWKISFKTFIFSIRLCFANTLLFSVVCCCSITKLCPTHGNPHWLQPAGSSILHCLRSMCKFMSIESVVLCSSSSATPFPSAFSFQHRSFSESALHQVAEDEMVNNTTDSMDITLRMK